LAAAAQAEQAFPASAFVPWLRGTIHSVTGLYAEAERDYKAAISISPDVPLYWFSLAVVYKHQDRIPETIQAQRHAIDLSTMPQPAALVKLARLYLDDRQPEKARETFDEAVRNASPELLDARGPSSLSFQADQGRAEAWRALGDVNKAAEFEQRSVQDLVPRQ
jgi:tetratricopeptide (TPR) repeat protein